MNRSPRFGGIARSNERCGHHPDDGVDIATKWDRFTNNLCIEIELFDPQIVTQNYNERRANLIVLGSNVAAHLGLHTKRFKESTSHLPDLELNGLRACGVRQWLQYHSTKSCDRFALRFDVGEIGRRLIRAKGNQSLRIRVGQGPKQYSVDDTEDCGVNSNPQAKRDHC